MASDQSYEVSDCNQVATVACEQSGVGDRSHDRSHVVRDRIQVLACAHRIRWEVEVDACSGQEAESHGCKIRNRACHWMQLDLWAWHHVDALAP